MSEWQPIETAPRDGSDLLLWNGYRWDVGWCSHERWLTAGSRFCPTHWMPLPEPPK